jgi:hypothetical protein
VTFRGSRSPLDRVIEAKGDLLGGLSGLDAAALEAEAGKRMREGK